jgi:hypothetical protein
MCMGTIGALGTAELVVTVGVSAFSTGTSTVSLVVTAGAASVSLLCATLFSLFPSFL